MKHISNKVLKTNKEFEELIPPLSKKEYTALEKSLIEEGCREAIITWNNTIVDGHNRYILCNKNKIGFRTISKKFSDKDDVITWMIDNQLARRNISTYDVVRLELKKESIFQKKANTKLKTHTKQGYQKSDKAVHTGKEVGKLAKVSHDTVARVKFIEKNADKNTKKKLATQELTINKVYRDLKKKEKREEITKEFEQPALPKKNKKYNIIYADPPWNFRHYSDKGKGRSADNHYKTMDLAGIKALPVNELAADNCVLFMWTTFPFLEKSFEVLKEWGFKYKTIGFVWVKKNKKADSWFWGMGYWTRSNAEICIIATKGSITRQSSSVSQIICEPIEQHSKKPAIVREKITELVGKLPRIELFARQTEEGWDAWGNEV